MIRAGVDWPVIWREAQVRARTERHWYYLRSLAKAMGWEFHRKGSRGLLPKGNQWHVLDSSHTSKK
jgi:hypothetical protein